MIGNRVPGFGNLQSPIMLIGEGPGVRESVEGRPFVGASGTELDWLYLRRAAGLNRQDLYTTNVVKWRTDENDSDPTDADIARDEAELLAEIEVVNPKILVAIGKVAATWLMQGQSVDLEKYTGVPISCPRYPDKALLICYHPAAGLHQPERYLHHIYWDFQQLGRLVRGEIGITKPHYTPSIKALYAGDILPSLQFPISVDTEGDEPTPWGVSFSTDPAFGYVTPHGTPPLKGAIEAHYILYDVRVLRKLGAEIDLRTSDDTMLMAYLFPWLPRALKPLMFKLCGMEQQTYEEVIKPAEESISKAYLEKVLAAACLTCGGSGEVRVPYKRQPSKFKNVRCDGCHGDGTKWPIPASQLLFNDDSSARIYKPRSIGRGIRAALERGSGYRESWMASPAETRHVIEGELGRMKEATLDDIPVEQAVHYSGIDACGTRAVASVLKPMLKEYRLEKVYEIDKGILPMIDRMYTNGILIDRDHFSKLHQDFTEQRRVIKDRLSEIATYSFNPSSPDQVGNLLYDRFHLKGRGFSTDEKTLEGLKIRYASRPEVVETIDLITDHRELTKLDGTYVLPLPLAADKSNRVHTRFLLHVTTSGRLSSRDPNLQNVPTRTERGRLIRKGFIAKPGCVLVSVDLDQIELRVGAHLSEDENMIDIFRTGKDIHRATASLIYKKPLEEITTQERMLSKTINFGVFYGMSAKRLHKELSLLGINVTLDDCIGFINDWFNAYPGIRDYMARCHAQAKDLGYVECLFGRRRYLPGVYSTIDKIREESLRWSVNHPDQATAAGILKLWMRMVSDNVLPIMESYGYCEPLLTIHDELITECQEDLADLFISLVVAEAQQSINLLVPIAAKGNYGHTWNDLK